MSGKLVPFLDLRPIQEAETQSGALALESAQALLGCVMIEPARFREAAHVRPEHFYEPAHALIWATIAEMVAKGLAPDLATMIDRMAENPVVAELGGAGFLFALVEKAGATGLARQHAQTVLDAHVRGSATALLAEGARALAGSPGRSAPAILAELRQALADVEQGSCDGDEALVTAEAAAGALVTALDHEAAHGRERGCMTGLRCFDRRLRGLRPGWLVVIGGRPSMGKSGLMRAAAYGAAKRNPEKAFLIFSLEMDARECAERALSAASFEAGDGLPYAEMGGGLAPEDRQRLAVLRPRMPCNVLIDERSRVDVDDVARRVWAVKARQPVSTVFIDYLQLLWRPSATGRSDALILGDVTRALKTLAREAETCVVLLSQLNRAVEGRDDKRPQLADLRDSGSIEQDANAVLFPYREAYYVERAEPKDRAGPEHARWAHSLEMVRRRLDVIAAKVRGGAIGTDRQAYFAEFDHVEDWREDRP